MNIYFSTVFRTAPIDQGGEIIKLDWDRKEVLARQPIIPSDPGITDPNPRGGTRGGRGILVNDKEVYVASYHSINVFDRALKPLRVFSNPLFADLHEGTWDGEHLWASSTVIDGAIKVDKHGNTVDSWWPREDPVIASHFGLRPLALDKKQDNRLAYLGRSHVEPGHTHLNTVAMLGGRPLVLLNQFGCVVQLKPTRLLLQDARLKGCHNILVTPDQHLLINDTVNQTIVVYDADGRLKKRISLKSYWPVRKIRWRFAVWGVRLWMGKHIPSFRVSWFLVKNIVASRPVFVRGLNLTKRGTIVVGISPASILEIDWKSGKLIDFYSYSKDVNCAVHGLTCA